MPSSVSFSEGFASGFRFAIPAAFAESLRTETFSAGDIFYDSRSAYTKPWGDALHDINHCLQVGAVFGLRLKIHHFVPTNQRDALHKMEDITLSPEELVTLLLKGFAE